MGFPVMDTRSWLPIGPPQANTFTSRLCPLEFLPFRSATLLMPSIRHPAQPSVAAFLSASCGLQVKQELLMIPDRPMSMFEGLAGAICFWADLLSPELAHFPGFELPSQLAPVASPAAAT